VTGKQAQEALDRAGMTVNKNTIPDDARGPMDPSGIRLGTPALTTRGMNEDDMRRVAAWFDDALLCWQDEAKLAAIQDEVRAFTSNFPLYAGLSYE
jgi:glycine hydroxymethyltransferase